MGASCETGEIEHQLLCVQESYGVSYGIYRLAEILRRLIKKKKGTGYRIL